jgi:hypothetical protein
MITCNLQGGLGNQIFQIMATIAYCIQHKVPFIFPYSDVLGDRPTYWDTFFDKLKNFTTSRQNFPDADPKDVIMFLHSLPKYQEPEYTYCEIPKCEKLILYGYFQSFKYFEQSKEQLFDIMDIKFKQLCIKTEYLDLFDDQNVISIHFRLGDYKDKQEFHPILPLDYYVNALSHITVPSKALVFCEQEDNDVIDGHLDILRQTFGHITFVKVNDDIPDWKQLIIMSCCNVNIIANSSFSWWGAYMNKNANKTVFHPDMWFGPMINNSVSDLFPRDWIEVSCRKIDS